MNGWAGRMLRIDLTIAGACRWGEGATGGPAAAG